MRGNANANKSQALEKMRGQWQNPGQGAWNVKGHDLEITGFLGQG